MLDFARAGSGGGGREGLPDGLLGSGGGAGGTGGRDGDVSGSGGISGLEGSRLAIFSSDAFPRVLAADGRTGRARTYTGFFAGGAC